MRNNEIDSAAGALSIGFMVMVTIILLPIALLLNLVSIVCHFRNPA